VILYPRRRANVGLYMHSAAWAKQQEKDNYPSNNGETEMENNGTPDTRLRNLDPWSPPENPFPTGVAHLQPDGLSAAAGRVERQEPAGKQGRKARR
jgi:hypothetical protein